MRNQGRQAALGLPRCCRRQLHSAPYQHVGDDLEGYLYQRIVQIFQGTELLAADPRARRKAEWHTRSEHYRPHKAALQGNTPERCREMARKVPPATAVVLASLLLERPLDQQCSGQVVLR